MLLLFLQVNCAYTSKIIFMLFSFFPDFLLRAYCSLVLSPCLISTALSESQVPGLEKVASVPATAPARCLDAVRCTAHRCLVFLSHVLLLKTAVLLLMKVQLLSPLSDALLKITFRRATLPLAVYRQRLGLLSPPQICSSCAERCDFDFLRIGLGLNQWTAHQLRYITSIASPSTLMVP